MSKRKFTSEGKNAKVKNMFCLIKKEKKKRDIVSLLATPPTPPLEKVVLN